MRLYSHALESIFALLELGDLAQLLAVSREWSAAVRSMKPIHASFAGDDWGTNREREVFRPHADAHAKRTAHLACLAAVTGTPS